MNQKISKILILLACCLCSVFAGFAQNSNPSNLTNSAYTRYGFGKMGSVGNAATRAMGDLGVVAYSNTFTNLYNPASLTAIDTLTMLVDAGLNGEWQFSSENGNHQSDFNSGFNYLSLHFPLWNRFAGAVSLTPYSMVGYYYGDVQKTPIDNTIVTNDTLKYSNTYQGNGGLQRIMASIGWRPIAKKSHTLNLGLNAGFIYGTVSHGGAITISSSQGQSTAVTRSFTAKGLELTAGLQYLYRINGDKMILIGGTFSPETPIKVHAENLKYTNTDTLSINERFNVSSPLKLGIGASYIVERKLQIGAEFSMENWGNVAGLNANLAKSDDIYKNITKFAAGIEYQPSVFNQNYFKTCHYRAGFNVKNSYIETYGSQNTEYTLSAGLGLPVGLTSRRRSIVNLALEYIHVQPSKSDMLVENYVNLSVGITFNEMMFFRNKLR